MTVTYIRALRLKKQADEQRSLPLYVVAEELGITAATLSGVELGKARPGYELLAALARYYEVDEGVLFRAVMGETPSEEH